MAENGFFKKMTQDAIDELAEGNISWREVSPNVLIMACFGMLTNHLSHKFLKPMWFFVGAVGTGVIWLIISSVFSF